MGKDFERTGFLFGANSVFIEELYQKFSKFVDELQSVLDKNKVCDEVHMIFENKNF